jgi:hypothetical protein
VGSDGSSGAGFSATATGSIGALGAGAGGVSGPRDERYVHAVNATRKPAIGVVVQSSHFRHNSSAGATASGVSPQTASGPPEAPASWGLAVTASGGTGSAGVVGFAGWVDEGDDDGDCVAVDPTSGGVAVSPAPTDWVGLGACVLASGSDAACAAAGKLAAAIAAARRAPSALCGVFFEAFSRAFSAVSGFDLAEDAAGFPLATAGRGFPSEAAGCDSAFDAAGFGAGPESPLARQPAGGATSTMLPHLGQVRICPMAASLRTFSRAWQVRQVMANTVRSTTPTRSGEEKPLRCDRAVRPLQF